VIFDDFEKAMLVRILSIFKKFLKDIVSKFVLRQFDAFLNQGFKDCIFGIGFAIGNDGLHCAGAVLVSCPLCRLIQII